MNMDDPSKQEQIRRGTHEYVGSEGKHGAYVPRTYDRSKNEYPKMMGKWPRPEMKEFRTVNGLTIPHEIAAQNLQAALVEWDRAMTSSIVDSRAEEQQWLKENAN